MSGKQGACKKWMSVGSSQTSPIENTKRAQVSLDSYYVVVGFEVNEPNAFIDGVHNLAVDYGHAFFYLVKNVTIVKSFSFGPSGIGKIGWFGNGRYLTYKKDGIQNARPATADYEITERVKAFKVQVSIQQATALSTEIDKARVEIYCRRLDYSPIMNDTCAETAKGILDESGVRTPSGSGWVTNTRLVRFPVVYGVNPYSWHANFKEILPEHTFSPELQGQWIPMIGEDDPIFGLPAFAKADPMFGVRL